eukprot:CAMPEP_0204334788 /NCGR_PEP_ID=MMETSP0469-20131031/18270_1 /ASSEMBLY_ACC=CAM_ASM_000384 /TAXON_ID=2969 /ORGANISM="Oxyrrhis marina" /LENGTH=532 /DNA_ID=CAMNT_0051318341 /DNA_START=35 /DNA_END=1629 /DNA_ORIENTATION=+
MAAGLVAVEAAVAAARFAANSYDNLFQCLISNRLLAFCGYVDFVLQSSTGTFRNAGNFDDAGKFAAAEGLRNILNFSTVLGLFDKEADGVGVWKNGGFVPEASLTALSRRQFLLKLCFHSYILSLLPGSCDQEPSLEIPDVPKMKIFEFPSFLSKKGEFRISVDEQVRRGQRRLEHMWAHISPSSDKLGSGLFPSFLLAMRQLTDVRVDSDTASRRNLLAELCRNCPIRSLDLTGVPIGYWQPEVPDVAPAVAAERDETLLGFVEALSKAKFLSGLRLRSCAINDDDPLAAVTRVMSTCQRLSWVDLSENEITDSGVHAMLKHFPSMKGLQSLELDGNKITQEETPRLLLAALNERANGQGAIAVSNTSATLLRNPGPLGELPSSALAVGTLVAYTQDAAARATSKERLVLPTWNAQKRVTAVHRNLMHSKLTCSQPYLVAKAAITGRAADDAERIAQELTIAEVQAQQAKAEEEQRLKEKSQSYRTHPLGESIDRRDRVLPAKSFLAQATRINRRILQCEIARTEKKRKSP